MEKMNEVSNCTSSRHNVFKNKQMYLFPDTKRISVLERGVEHLTIIVGTELKL